jgi:hypothetical protein
MWSIYRAHMAWNIDVASYCIQLVQRQLAEGTYHDLEVAKGDRWTGTNPYTSDIRPTPRIPFDIGDSHAFILTSNTSINMSAIATSHPPQEGLHDDLLEAHL